MHSLVTLDTATGAIRRYERAAPRQARMTHEAFLEDDQAKRLAEGRAFLLQADVEAFRVHPSDEFAIKREPDARPAA